MTPPQTTQRLARVRLGLVLGVAVLAAGVAGLGYLVRAMERARAEGWQIKAYNRDWRLPVSAVSHTFSTVAMQVPNFMSVRFRDVSLPKAAEPPPVPEPADEELPPGAVVSPMGRCTCLHSLSGGR